jgi:hypothetical protein
MQFKHWAIEMDDCDYPTCELVDWDGDGRLDLVVGRLLEAWTGPGEITWFRNVPAR